MMDQNRFDAALSGRPLPVESLAWHRQEYRPMVEYAGFWRRFFASSLDGILTGIVTLILQAAVTPFFERFVDPPETWGTALGWFAALEFVYVIVIGLYCAGLESSAWQATLGKRALGIVVTDVAGNRVSFGRATGRYFAHYLSMLTFLIGYLVQPFTERRQALHDLIAGTVVVRKGSAVLGTPLIPAPRDDQHRRGGMPGWAKGLIAGVIVLCIGCASLGYFVAWPLINKREAAATQQVAETVADSVSLRIESSSLPAGRIVLREADLDVNNGVGDPGEAGWIWGTGGIVIYGFETSIDSSGITLGTNGVVIYRVLPTVANGRVELTANNDSDGIGAFILPEKSFEQGLEHGINQAIAEKGLRSTGVTLRNGSLIILVAPVESSEVGYGMGTCGSAAAWPSAPRSVQKSMREDPGWMG